MIVKSASACHPHGTTSIWSMIYYIAIETHGVRTLEALPATVFTGLGLGMYAQY